MLKSLLAIFFCSYLHHKAPAGLAFATAQTAGPDIPYCAAVTLALPKSSSVVGTCITEDSPAAEALPRQVYESAHPGHLLRLALSWRMP